MLELDAVVRENQLNCLPVSKSGQAEAELLEIYPDLPEKIERSRRSKVDAVSLHSRLHERESRQGIAAKAKADLLEDFAPSPAMQKDQRHRTSKDHGGTPKSPVLPPAKSPVLSVRKSSADLIFDMEDDDDGNGAFQTPKRRQRKTTDSPHMPASNLGLDDDDVFPSIRLSQSPGATAALSTSAKSPSSYRASGRLEDHSLQPTPGAQKPWASSSFHSPRVGMKDIISQASSGRTSSISSAFTTSSHPRNISTVSLATKMSQKERKRQQLQQMFQASATAIPQRSDTDANQSGQKTPASPWQIASRGPKVNLKDVFDTAGSTSAGSKADVVRTPSPMTLRQTVSGKPSLAQRSVSGPPSFTPLPASQQQSTPSKGIPAMSHANSASSPKATDFQTIQSIRHTPAPAEPTLQLSMADILAQQNREKEIIKEAAAKRSLQEIQEEQAFQEWWDLESKKAKEEEEAAQRSAVATSRRGKPGSRRLKSSRGGRGDAIVKGKQRDDENATESSTTARKGSNVTRGGAKRGGRPQ